MGQLDWDRARPRCQELPTTPRPEIGTVLVTGATGYIGGRLVPELLARGYRVRLMVRRESPEELQRWPTAEIVVADALDPAGLVEALRGVHTAYYLIHSLHLGMDEFESADIRAAANFREAAEANGIDRIIYLGGLGEASTDLSAHLKSRMRVADELDRGPVSTTTVRAAMIIGSGSISYEILKRLVTRLPLLFIPRWARTECQPISIRDVVKYLIGVLETPASSGRTFDIGGREIVRYDEILRTFARLMRKKRLFLPSPVASVGVYSYVASLVSPVPASVTRCLLGGCRNRVVCHNDDITRLIPLDLITLEDALLRALSREEQDDVSMRWAEAYPPAYALGLKLRELDEPPEFVSVYEIESRKSPSTMFRSICKIGRKEGRFYANWMWHLRGLIDRLLLGVGTSRNRREHGRLRIADVVDCWRVEELEPDSKLLLRAEMKLPGRAWLQFDIRPEEERTRLSTTAYFDPSGLFGRIYWYSLLPFHAVIFRDLITQIERRRL